MPNSDRTPTDAQANVLDTPGRIRVVQAAPGSGKTWLIAEVIRREVTSWKERYGGIAALSFTNVAGSEIRSALGRSAGHPHFIGTIDSFLYRFVVRPFAVWASGGTLKQPRLIAAEHIEFLDREQWGYRYFGVPTGRGDERIHLSEFSFRGWHPDKATPVFSYTVRGVTHQTSRDLSADVYRRKKEVWQRTGRMTHSDVAFLASQILCTNPNREQVRDILIGRFPMIIVDELQDTGRDHILALRALLRHPQASGLLVGDPDQSIYGFNGADPGVFAVFENLDGSVPLSLDATRRCAPEICAVANHLSMTRRHIVPGPNVGPGRAVLVVHDDDLDGVLSLACGLAERLPSEAGDVTLLVRRNDEADQFLGDHTSTDPVFKSPPLKALFRAARYYRTGKRRAAVATAEAALARVLFRSPSVTVENLDDAGISPVEWKKAVGEILLSADEYVTGENVYEWGCRMKARIDELLTARGWRDVCPDAMTVRRPAKATEKIIRQVPEQSVTSIPGSRLHVKTVHGAKGETHHTTIYYVPTPRGKHPCPSDSWWNGNDAGEERRIAFVAATRAQTNFILCLGRDAFERMRVAHPEFVALFEVAELGPELCDSLALLTRNPVASVFQTP